MNEKNFYIKKLVSLIFITILLLYFMIKTPSPKIIFIPFLLCSLSCICKYVLLLIDNYKYISIFDIIYNVSFFMYWFGFLIFADYICIRDKKWSLLAFSLIFWIVGVYYLIKFIHSERRNKDE